MATIIHFGEGRDYIQVQESVDEVLSKVKADAGNPVQLIRADGRGAGEPVVINPANVNYWYESGNHGVVSF